MIMITMGLFEYQNKKRGRTFMKEIWKMEKPQSVRDAAQAQKGLHIILELLISVAVFIVALFAQNLIVIAGTVVMLFTNSGFWETIMSGDQNAAMTFGLNFEMGDSYMILILLSNAGMILITLLFCKLLQKRKMNTVGFRKKGVVAEYIGGAVVGFVLFSAAVAICVLTGSLKLEGLSSTFAPGTFLLFVVGFMIQGMAEEVMCRGYLMVSVGRRYSMFAAILANSLFFAALHLANNGISVLAVINLTLIGILLSVYFIKRDNIWGVGALHSVWNLVQGNVYGIRVSGMQTTCTVLSSEMVEGKELIHGGDFGLEGGLAVTIVCVVGIVILLFMKAKTPTEVLVNE